MRFNGINNFAFCHSRPYLEKNLKLQSDRIHRKVDSVLAFVQKVSDRIENIILVESFADTLKVGIVLWALTYIGAYLSTMVFAIFGKRSE